MTRHFGYLPDKPDPRDFDFLARLGGTVPLMARTENLDMLAKVEAVLDQLTLGSCVVNAGLAAIRVKNALDGVEHPKLGSRLTAYYMLRAYIGTEGEDSGGYVRDFFRACNRYGFAPESEYPYDVKRFTDPPPPNFFRLAFDQKEPAVYSRVSSLGAQRIAELKAAIDDGMPIVGGALVGNDFLDWTGSIGIPCPLTTGGKAGGHAVYFAGYNQAGLVGVNSWGRSWGESGKFTVSWDDASRGTVDDLMDVWVVERAPYFSEAA